jgi:hypothetical protein
MTIAGPSPHDRISSELLSTKYEWSMWVSRVQLLLGLPDLPITVGGQALQLFPRNCSDIRG